MSNIMRLEDTVVIQRRSWIDPEKGVQYELVVVTTHPEPDSVIGILERAKWAVGSGDYYHEAKMHISGLPELEPKDDEEEGEEATNA